MSIQLGQLAVAVEEWRHAIESPAFQHLPPGRRADHLVTVARGLLQAGDAAGAGQALVIADSTAQAEVRSRPSTYELMTMVMRHDSRPTGSVARLAEIMGVTM